MILKAYQAEKNGSLHPINPFSKKSNDELIINFSIFLDSYSSKSKSDLCISLWLDQMTPDVAAAG